MAKNHQKTEIINDLVNAPSETVSIHHNYKLYYQLKHYGEKRMYEVHLKSCVRILKMKNRRPKIFYPKIFLGKIKRYQALRSQFDVVFMSKHEFKISISIQWSGQFRLKNFSGTFTSLIVNPPLKCLACLVLSMSVNFHCLDGRVTFAWTCLSFACQIHEVHAPEHVYFFISQIHQIHLPIWMREGQAQ